MFPSYEKKPNKTSWFSSLRRQPKAKKNNHADKKPDPSGNHGRSCGNLTTTNCSTTASPNHINQYETNKNRLNEQHHGVQTSSSNAKDGKQLTNGSANNFQTGRYDTILCKKCMAEWRSNALIDVQLCDLVRKRECSYNIKTYNTIVDDVNVKTKLTTINSGGSTPSSPTKSINGTDGSGSGKWHKQVQQVTTKTTFTEKATFLAKQSHRVGLVFNDNGELLSNVDALRTLKQFAEKTGTVISVNNNVKKSTITWGSSDNLIDPTKELPLTSNKLLECDDIEFIDSSSTSPSDVSSGGDLISDRSTDRLITKVCSSCKTKFKSKSDWNLSNKEQIKDELCEVVSEMEKLEVQDDYKHSNKDKQMSIGRKKFNMDPKKGIEYLCENHLLQMDPQDIADFLYKGEGLNKTAIGDYLGEKNDFNEQVLKAFVDLHDFTNLILVQALRQFLWSFRLPGEAQKIDRMMECFAQRYCQLNPDIFTNTDTCYVLSFAIIMLNTSLHNPSVRDKPSVEQFIALNRGINNGGDLPRELLESLYESIKTEPFKIPQDDGNDLMHTFFNPDKEGWLWKQGGRYKSWKRRWFILNDNCLYYFEYTTDKEPRGIIPLENINVREIQDRNKPYCFELYATSGADIIKACKTDSEGKVVEGKHTVYRMSAATQEDQLEWMKCLKQSISHNPFYDILVQRKKKALAKS